MTEPAVADVPFRKVSIIGLGLIGGSLAAGLKHAGLAQSLCGYDSNAASLEAGLRLSLIDTAADSVAEAIIDADLVVLCVPVKAVAAMLPALKGFPGIITDVGSVKSPLIKNVVEAFGFVPTNLVPAHPIAGSEKHGIEAADRTLFSAHQVILTPTPATNSAALQRVEFLWRSLGATVVQMTPAHHDEVLAQTSHLPHLLAYALVDTLSRQGDSLEVFEYAAGGFRDFSRIAASDPVMWRDIFATNQAPVLQILDKYLEELQMLKGMIEQHDTDGLEQVFKRAKIARDHFSSLDAIRREGGK